VFERFYRGEGVGGDGSGLGLAIVKEGAGRHDAAVSIGVPPNGAGTYVRITFGRPADASRVPASSASPAYAAPAMRVRAA
jgi:signal transduction histidine kinase